MELRLPIVNIDPLLYQEHRDGPLNSEFRARIKRVRAKLRLPLVDIGKEFGISGPFASNLLREINPGRVRSVHIPRFVNALEELEKQAGLRPRDQDDGRAASQNPPTDHSMEELIRLAHKNGFAVTFTPLPRD
jgi:hypothetical protein